jgi:hypothetical protein
MEGSIYILGEPMHFHYAFVEGCIVVEAGFICMCFFFETETTLQALHRLMHTALYFLI